MTLRSRSAGDAVWQILMSDKHPFLSIRVIKEVKVVESVIHSA